ncbi:MAG TPA: hypothetical protein VF014_12925 [Casimicrobiaceae bacterium]|nr:hypothetical protein [Casimicrobiaceae bacterium]
MHWHAFVRIRYRSAQPFELQRGELLARHGFQLVLAAAVAFAGVFGLPIAALAGLLAALAGAWLKLVLVTRAGFNQGFALAHLPVRNARP